MLQIFLNTEGTPMASSPSFLFSALSISLALFSCTPLAVTPQTAEEKQDAYERDRYQAKINYDPSAPQTISGFFAHSEGFLRCDELARDRASGGQPVRSAYHNRLN